MHSVCDDYDIALEKTEEKEEEVEKKPDIHKPTHANRQQHTNSDYLLKYI